MNIHEAFHDPELCKALIRRLHDEAGKPLRFMEVCGTHTVSIFQSGLRSLLPETVTHISGPGCPVCVTHESEVAAFIDLAARDDVIVATFGDLMRVPGPGGANLKKAQAEGARVQIIYAPFDALKIARENPDATVVFLGIGFETTAPTVAATIKMAKAEGLTNFRVMSFHKLVPPALRALLDEPGGEDSHIDAFILPGHVSTILGVEPYEFLASEYGVPSAVTGFEPLDILHSLLFLVECRNEGRAEVANLYGRAVADSGNAKARALMAEVFRISDALWRGIGTIPDSGLVLAPEFEAFDAMTTLGIELTTQKPLPGCRCGEVLKGRLSPAQCPLFRKACTPATPVGPCMVSTEGSCAAYFKYNVE